MYDELAVAWEGVLAPHTPQIVFEPSCYWRQLVQSQLDADAA